MVLNFNKLEKITEGLSKKKVYKQIDKKLNKVIIDFSDIKEDYENFLNTVQILQKKNISIPSVYEVQNDNYVICMEDFGQKRFDKILEDYDIYQILKLAVDNLIIIHNSIFKNELNNLKTYSFIDLKNEISEFIDFYLPFKKKSNILNKKFYEVWEKTFYSQDFNFDYFVHRDFEFVNLFYLPNKKGHLKCGIIDFQSAFVGFAAWDLFSILENPRLNITREYNENLIEYFYNNSLIKTDYKTFRDQYYILNTARLTRLLGRWTKLFNQDGHKKYLNFIDITFSRLNISLKNINNKKLISIYNNILD